MIPHSWIIRCLEIFKVADNIKEFIKKSMSHWETELTSGGQSLGKIKIQRGIFHGDSLSPLLFVICLILSSLILRTVQSGLEFRKSGPSINHLLYMDDVKLFGKTEKQLESLMNAVRIVSDDIRMEFGIKKCGLLVMKKGNKFVAKE